MKNLFTDRVGNPLPNPHNHQAHGLTVAQMANLRVQQEEETVELMPCNNARPDQIKDAIFREAFSNYQIPRVESHIYVVAVEPRLFDHQTGERLSVATVHKFTREAYEFMKENHGFSGKVVHILHNPELN